MRVLLIAALLAAPASAAVVQSAPDGFTIEQRVAIATPPAETWNALVDWGGWWPDAHSYSGKASNIELDLEPNGELEEEWGEEEMALHAILLQARPGRMLRLSGGFGPLQAMPVTAILDVSLQPDGAGTALTMTYRVAGQAAMKFDSLAPAVDRVFADALARLVTHRAEPKPPEAEERPATPEKPASGR